MRLPPVRGKRQHTPPTPQDWMRMYVGLVANRPNRVQLSVAHASLDLTLGLRVWIRVSVRVRVKG